MMRAAVDGQFAWRALSDQASHLSQYPAPTVMRFHFTARLLGLVGRIVPQTHIACGPENREPLDLTDASALDVARHEDGYRPAARVA